LPVDRIIGTQQKAPRKRQGEREGEREREGVEGGREEMLQKWKKGEEQCNLTLGLCSTQYAATTFTVQYFV
jgi:hypothetical protein